MKSHPNEVNECHAIDMDRHVDGRGFFQEVYNEGKYQILPFSVERGETIVWRQVNWSQSKLNVLRGIHVSPYNKLVTCVKGRIYDVIVDLRPWSSTYLQWAGVPLDEDRPTQVLVPAHCGHGFVSLQEGSSVFYLQGDVYNPANEWGVRWNDEDIGVRWPCVDPILSDKDAAAPTLRALGKLN